MRSYSICSHDTKTDSSSTMFKMTIAEALKDADYYRSRYPNDRITISYYDGDTKQHGVLFTFLTKRKKH